MGIFTYKRLDTDEEFELVMTIAEMEEFEVDNKNKFTRVLKPVAFGDSVRLGITKTPDSFNDLLKSVKKKNLHSTINNKNGEV